MHDLPSCSAKGYGINDMGTAIWNNESGLGVGNGRRKFKKILGRINLIYHDMKPKVTGKGHI